MKSDKTKLRYPLLPIIIILILSCGAKAEGERSAPDALDVCLENAMKTVGEYDETRVEFRDCYKQWVGTVGSDIESYVITRHSYGSFPCYHQESAVFSAGGTLILSKKYNDSIDECLPDDGEVESRSEYKVKIMQVEILRSLLNRKKIHSLNDEYRSKDILDSAGTKWVFILNNDEPKEIMINQMDVKGLPLHLGTIVAEVNSLIYSIPKN